LTTFFFFCTGGLVSTYGHRTWTCLVCSGRRGRLLYRAFLGLSWILFPAGYSCHHHLIAVIIII
jgi:hypothetical protein